MNAKALSSSLFLMLLCGCVSNEPTPGKRVKIIDPGPGPIEEIYLFGSPVALDLDAKPGPEGLGVRIYASSSIVAKGKPIRSGTLELLMLDAIPTGSVQLTPRHTWTFTPQALKAFETETSLGVGYKLVLEWGSDKPPGNTATVLARYRPERGPAIYSSPSTVALTVK